MILILFQPLVIILFDFRCPFGIDLSGGVFLLSQTLVSKHVFKVSAFGVVDNLLSQLGRDEDHTAIPSRTTSPGITSTWPMRVGPLMLTMVELSSFPLARLPK